MKTLLIITLLGLLAALAFYTVTSHSADQSPQRSNLQLAATNPELAKLSSNSEESTAMPATKHLDSIVLGAGCFWGAEKRYATIPGVVDAISGYADGSKVRPEYSAITQYKNKFNPNNHAEVVKVIYNRSMVSLETLLQNYFEGHDPTQVNRQGNDVGTQYRSTILINSPEQQEIAQQVTAQYQQLLSQNDYGAIATKIKTLNEFFPAEEYHQDYLVKNPNGYCPDHSTGVKFDAKTNAQNIVDNSALLNGKQIIVIESESYCPYCEKFKAEVASDYQGTIPMTFRLASQLQNLSIQSPTWATPTILFLQDGQEVFGRQGYLSSEAFYQALGAFKLGKTEAYKVAFNQGTDGRFCKQYEIFKHTPDGVFVDKLSGAPLFDTRDRFDSGSGWLSFTKPVDDSVVEKEDLSYGMRRTEIRSKSSNIHLGHVFPDGPGGKPRYCINATVLEFKPREES